MRQKLAALALAGLCAFAVLAGSLLTPPTATPANPQQTVLAPRAPLASPALTQADKKPQPKRGRGYKPLTPERRAYFQKQDQVKNGNRIQLAAKNLALPAAFDCRTKNPLPVWDQGQCGSCYLVSTARVFTDAGLMIGVGKPDGSFIMSAQYGMDSPRNFGGCDGGNGNEVADWACKNGWIAERYVDASGVAHNDYPPYEAQSGRDRTKAGARVWMKDWTWGYVNSNNHPTAQEIKAALFLHGRLNVAIDAGGQFGNGTGTITSLGTGIDHEICIAGWDDNKDGGAFLLENQWGTDWGNGGYRYVTYAAAANLTDIFWVSAGTIPPPPVPPVPPGPTPNSLKDLVDGLFARVEGDSSFYVRWALEWVRVHVMDPWLDRHPNGGAPMQAAQQAAQKQGHQATKGWPFPIPPGMAKVIVNGLLDALKAQYPGWAWIIQIAESAIDAYLDSQAQSGVSARQGCPCGPDCCCQGACHCLRLVSTPSPAPQDGEPRAVTWEKPPPGASPWRQDADGSWWYGDVGKMTWYGPFRPGQQARVSYGTFPGYAGMDSAFGVGGCAGGNCGTAGGMALGRRR